VRSRRSGKEPERDLVDCPGPRTSDRRVLAMKRRVHWRVDPIGCGRRRQEFWSARQSRVTTERSAVVTRCSEPAMARVLGGFRKVWTSDAVFRERPKPWIGKPLHPIVGVISGRRTKIVLASSACNAATAKSVARRRRRVLEGRRRDL
jgi:hypothetical protein